MSVQALLNKIPEIEDIKFLGQVKLPTGTQFKETEVGGLSGITYDPRKNVYYSISDDRMLATAIVTG